MIIAIVGRSHAGKKAIAKQICGEFKGVFARFKPYTTRSWGSCIKPHNYMSLDEYYKLSEDDIFYTMTNEHNDILFALKSQFSPDKDVVLVVDDPAHIAKLCELGIPYVVVYVTCSDEYAEHRARVEHDNLRIVKRRFQAVRPRLEELEASGNYSYFFDTSSLAESAKRLGVVYMLRDIRAMRSENVDIEHMPFLAEILPDGWMDSAKQLGFYGLSLAPSREG